MELITKTLSALASEAFGSCGYNGPFGVVTVSDRLELCQFQCNGSFAAAKQYKKAPFFIAEEVAAVLKKDARISSAEVAKPGFINIILSDEYITEFVNTIASDPFHGVPQIAEGEKVLVDYGGANVAKPLHVGHLRSAIIGESLKRLAAACGAKTVGDVHLGDWGLQIGLVIAELSERYPQRKCFSEDFKASEDSIEPITEEELSEVYPYASKKSKENEEFSKKAHIATKELQSGRPGYVALWQEIMRVSKENLKSNYDALNVNFEWWYGESDAEKYVPELMDILNEKGLIYESNGAKVVDVCEPEDKNPMPPVIIKKSDNSNIYATMDLATLLQRRRDFAPDRIWYVVDNRQSLHLTQVFRCARKAGITDDSTEITHCSFGTMNGTDGKPYKTRDGGVMRLSDLIDIVTNAAYEKLSSSLYVSEDGRREAARKVGVAALKFGDMINQRSKDYVFDLDKFLSFEGKTGTYLLYTVTRINSILKKTDISSFRINGVYTASERDLCLKLILSGESFVHAFDEKAPNYICENAYSLAAAFSRFYHDNRIIDEQDQNKRASWIGLITIVRSVIEEHLRVLAIESVENM